MLECAIIGGGPAGLTAGLYTTRGGLSNVTLFETGMPGGQITSSSEVENYPGQLEIITGMDLMMKWPEQAMRFGLKIAMDNVVKIEKTPNNVFLLTTGLGEKVEALSVIIATGSVPKKGGFEGEDTYFGRGVSTCATCDGFFYRGKEVIVLGGGDSALEEAHYLAKMCKKVTIIHRRESFRAAPSTVERIKHTENIEIYYNARIEKALGDESGLTGALIRFHDGSEAVLSVPGIFVFVGRTVNNSFVFNENGDSLVSLNENGEIIVDLGMKTSLSGVFAAGDVRSLAPRQVVCAAGDGATAALGALSYIDHCLSEKGANK